MGIKGLLHNLHVFYLVLFLVGFQGSAQGRFFSIKKPDPKNAAATARWLVSQNFWGVLKYALSLSRDVCFDILFLAGAPFL